MPALLMSTPKGQNMPFIFHNGAVFTSTQVVLSLQFTTFEITDFNGAAVVLDAPLLVKTVGVKSLMKKTIL